MTLSARMREAAGMTIAVWAPPDEPPASTLSLLVRTLDDVELFIDPRNVVLVVDGSPAAEAPAHEAAQIVRARAGSSPRVDCRQANEGQGGAVLRGLEALLGAPGINYLCTRDMDGDHDIYDVPQLYRRLEELVEQEGAGNAFVVGARESLHRPMGYARGEFETVLNEVTVCALTAAGHPPDLTRCRSYAGYPDFQTGFKMYTRHSAQTVVEALRAAQAEHPRELPLRWGVQFITTLELLLSGATPAQVCRLTFDEQPKTTFEGLADLPRAYGCQIAWLLRRLSLSPEMAWPIVDGALCATLFATTPGGWEIIGLLREYVADRVWGLPAPPAPRRGFMF